jgi:hypothetical protein
VEEMVLVVKMLIDIQEELMEEMVVMEVMAVMVHMVAQVVTEVIYQSQ